MLVGHANPRLAALGRPRYPVDMPRPYAFIAVILSASSPASRISSLLTRHIPKGFSPFTQLPPERFQMASVEFKTGSGEGVWWAVVVSNHRPLACEASALPLS
jgi:hypothetical protein